MIIHTRRQTRSTAFLAQALEPRRLLSTVFTPGPYVQPANTPDNPLDMAAAPFPPEPLIRINPTNPSNFIVASQYNERAITAYRRVGFEMVGDHIEWPEPGGPDLHVLEMRITRDRFETINAAQ